MVREAWRATVHGDAKELDMTKQQQYVYMYIYIYMCHIYIHMAHGMYHALY